MNTDPLRLAYGSALPPDELFDALDAPAVELIEEKKTSQAHIVEYRSVMDDIEGNVTAVRRKNSEGFGCVHFTGPDRIEMAMALASILLYAPFDVLHASARMSPDPDLRLASLKVLGQVYRENEGFPTWDREIEATVLLASRDYDVDVRARAGAVALVGNDTLGRRLVGDMLAREQDAKAIELLRAYLEATKKEPIVGETIPVDESLRRTARLALPTLTEDSLEQTLARFDASFPRPEVPIRGDEEEGTLEVSLASGDGATMIYWAALRWGVGCVNLFGPDRALFAMNIGFRVNYFPIELAKLVASQGKIAHQRALAVIALGMASSSRFLPLSSVDPEVRRLVEDRTKDPDEEVRGAAQAAIKMLEAQAA